jgi:biopolymer transport protein ExbB
MTLKNVFALLLQASLAFAMPAFAQDAADPVDPAAAPAAVIDSPAADPAAATDPAAAAVPADAAVEPAADAVPADAASVVDEAAETVDNPYGLGALWAQGDYIAKGTLVILAIMSAFTWYILFTKLWEQTRLMGQAKAALSVWQAKSLAEGAQQLPADSAFRGLVEDGLNAMRHHDGKLTDQIDQQEWVAMSVQRSVDGINSELQSGIAFLATVGSCSPFIGLFGTVWGIYHALVAIGVSGQASIDKVAGPVGEALIMTAIGLAVAVPAVLGYNWLVRRNKITMDRVRNFAADVQAVLVVGARVASADRND